MRKNGSLQDKWRRTVKLSYSMRMLTALSLGLLVGYVLQSFPQVVETVVKPIGNFFLYVLKIIVVPLMVITISCSIVSAKKKARVGKLVGSAFIYFLLTTLLASVMAIVFSVMMQDVYPMFRAPSINHSLVNQVPMAERVLEIFKENILTAVTSGNVLLFIIIAFLLGFLILFLGDRTPRLSAYLDKASQIVPRVRPYFRRIAPVAMFFIFTSSVASYGAELVGNLASFIGACYFCFIAYALLVYTPLLYFLGKVNPFHFFWVMQRPVMFAMAAESSIVTIPYSVWAAKRLGVDASKARLIIPLGVTFHLDGSSVFLSVASVFVAACYGVPLTLSACASVVIVSSIASLCVVGIPGGSLLVLPLVFATLGIPMEGVLLVAGVDRLVDMGRTVLSVMGDVVCAVVLQKFLKSSDSIQKT